MAENFHQLNLHVIVLEQFTLIEQSLYDTYSNRAISNMLAKVKIVSIKLMEPAQLKSNF